MINQHIYITQVKKKKDFIYKELNQPLISRTY